MLNFKIKRESPESEPSVEPPNMSDEPSLFVEDDNPPQAEDEAENMDDIYGADEGETEPLMQPGEAAWQNCGDLDKLHQVLTKEQAVEDALVFIDKLDRVLKRYSSKINSVKKWLSRIQEIRSRKKTHRVLVGFLGASGCGKSTLVNALLGDEDLLPADDMKACTAVVIEISYQTKDLPTPPYEGIVDRISAEEWGAELKILFEELANKEKEDEYEDGDGDAERDQRIMKTFHKVQVLYPEITAIENLKQFNVSRLLEHVNVKDILGETKNISSFTRADFTRQIKEYINSKDPEAGNENSFSQWPLVKLVSLYVKSEILKDGVVLVDLPGYGDTNVARGSIADSYQKNLAVNCVLAASDRPISNSAAHDLLGKVAQRTLTLENRLTSETLCFIVTKTDDNIRHNRLIEQHSILRGELGPLFQQKHTLEHDLGELQNFCKNLEKGQTTDNRRLSRRTRDLWKEKAIRDKPKGSEAQGNQTVRQTRPKKRKRADDVEVPGPSDSPTEIGKQQASLAKIESIMRDIEETQERIAKSSALLRHHTKRTTRTTECLERVESRIKSTVIKYRNKLITEAIRKDFAVMTESLPRKNNRPLGVFCVSSHAFFDIRKNTKPYEGFPKLKDSNISSLSKWLVGTTLASREQSADAFLHAVEGLELSMASWLQKSTNNFKITTEMRGCVETIFNSNFEALQKNLSNLNLELVKNCKDLIQKDLGEEILGVQSKAAEDAIKLVKSWCKLPWATHRATNKGKGDWTTTKGQVIQWNEDLVGLFLDPLLKQWTKTVHELLPGQKDYYNAGVSLHINKFLNQVRAAVLEISPEIAIPVDQWKESITRTPIQIVEVSTAIFSGPIAAAANSAHRHVKPTIEEHWEPIYIQCGAESGRGHNKRNKKTHMDHIKNDSMMMYQDCAASIQGTFDQLWTDLPTVFKNEIHPISSNIREEFLDMIINNTSDSGLKPAERSSTITRNKLSKDTMRLFNKLKSSWAELSISPADEDEENIDEDRYIPLPDLNELSESEDDGSDVSDSEKSDLEDDSEN